MDPPSRWNPADQHCGQGVDDEWPSRSSARRHGQSSVRWRRNLGAWGATSPAPSSTRTPTPTAPRNLTALRELALLGWRARWTNAVRYSPPGENALITASWYGDQVEIRVIDRGPGVPAEAVERLFVPFQRLGDRDNHAGVGLGLALSRGLTEAMGGTLTPEETPGGGLTMIVKLPISARAMTA